ncbi:hypothetical protein [Sulfuricurvum sp.]|uniref:hypothetical protein n=1 Tax=Sulfuricurvum sp. TaxID=2025608 RepID=UPI00260DE26F|nr:hypothetical protein [Sulfuricurvum sp.]MDD2266152.1 hypothetical protein [Sulfuricurvum sp.]MDD2784059.1 hypothetical protein [Sulfuricurvum sp.]
MILDKTIASAEVILIEGERGVGKNMLATFIAAASGLKNPTQIVTIPEETFYKKNEITKKMMGDNAFVFEHAVILNNDWKNSKRHMGMNFLFNDIEKLLRESETELLYIQRIDLFFDMMDQIGSFEILSDIVRLVLSKKIKTVITLLKGSENYSSIHDALLNYADLTLSIAFDNTQKGREVQVLSSFYPLENTLHSFVYTDQSFTLLQQTKTEPVAVGAVTNILPVEVERPLSRNHANINIAIIAHSSYLSGWNEYLFGNLVRIAVRRFRQLSELSDEMWSQSSLIVYETETVMSAMMFLEKANTNYPQLKTMIVLEKDFVRAEDKIRAHQFGATGIYDNKIRIIDYVLTIEKTLGNTFYSDSVRDHMQTSTVESESNFIELIELSLRARRIFTVFVFTYTVPFQNERFDTIFREDDVAFLDNEHHKFYLMLSNTQKTDYEVVLKKFLLLKEDVIFDAAYEAPTLFSGEVRLFEHTFGSTV